MSCKLQLRPNLIHLFFNGLQAGNGLAFLNGHICHVYTSTRMIPFDTKALSVYCMATLPTSALKFKCIIENVKNESHRTHS